MTNLVVRKIPSDFDASVPFMWQPALRQEAQHASAHRKHMLALVARYPQLERCYKDACSRRCCRRRPTTTPPTSRCPTGPTPGCVNTTAAPT